MDQGAAHDWLTDYAPASAQHLHGAQTVRPRDIDPVLLELARLRIAGLLRNRTALAERSAEAEAAGLTEEKIRAIPQWPTSELFTAIDRACLGLAEQFVIDVGGVSDEDVARVADALGPAGLYGFVQCLYVTDMSQRLDLALGAVAHHLSEEGPSDRSEVLT